jgi:hypothetical protein
MDRTPETTKPIVADYRVDEIFKGIINSSGRIDSDYKNLTHYLNRLLPHNTTITNNNPDTPENELIQAKINYQYLITLLKKHKPNFPFDTLVNFIDSMNRPILPIPDSADFKKVLNLARALDNQF